MMLKRFIMALFKAAIAIICLAVFSGLCVGSAYLLTRLFHVPSEFGGLLSVVFIALFIFLAFETFGPEKFEKLLNGKVK